MQVFFDGMVQTFMAGDDVCGQCYIPGYLKSQGTPSIFVSGYTLVWKPDVMKETDEYNLFYHEEAELIIPEVEDSKLFVEKSGLICFRFKFILPENLPSSHEVPIGHIRYKIQAFFNGETVFKYFGIMRWVGLERRANRITKEAKLKLSLCRPFQRIDIETHLNETSYFPGEVVYFSVTIHNNSPKDILFSKLLIIQTTKYWKTHHIVPIKYDRILAEDIIGQIPSGSTQEWDDQSLKIPIVIPTTLKCPDVLNYFEIKYKLQINVTLKNFHKKLSTNRQLFIGNMVDPERNKMIGIPKTPFVAAMTSKDKASLKLEKLEYIPQYIGYHENEDEEEVEESDEDSE